MDQQDRMPGGPGMGGPANTPSFGSDPGALRTAADRQIPEETSPSHGASASGGMGGSSGGGSSSGSPEAAQQLKERAGEMAGQAEERINQGMKQAANRLDSMAQQLDQVADERLGGDSGVQARAGKAAHTVADTLESVAGYLRDNDAQALRGQLERQMRERPVQSLMMAVAAGWLVGKIVR